jgi:RES domain-containing protein
VIPPVRNFNWNGAHRLIPSLYSETGTILSAIAEDDEMLADVVLLDGATNDRVQGEQRGLEGISTYELVYGIPHANIVNAAFTHTSDDGCRFNDRTRGAWYAARDLETSLAEVTYHKARRLAQIVVAELPLGIPDTELSTYDDWLADFHADFHVLEPAEQFSDCLLPEPVPECYATPQKFAREILQQRSNGIVYPSVRRAPSLCLVCFRPALVYSPRRGHAFEIRFKATKSGYKTQVHRLPSV